MVIIVTLSPSKDKTVSKVLKNFKVDSISTELLGGIWEEGFVSKFKALCKKGDIVVLLGGTGSTVKKDIYKELITISKEKGAYTILEAEGELLKEGIKAKPDLIKSNEDEFKALMDVKTNCVEEMLDKALVLKSKGINNILISLGERGALYVTERGHYFSKGITVPVKNAVGTGDSMVAAVVYSILNKFDDIETLKYASACGAATATLDSTASCTLEDVLSFLDKVDILKNF